MLQSVLVTSALWHLGILCINHIGFCGYTRQKPLLNLGALLRNMQENSKITLMITDSKKITVLFDQIFKLWPKCVCTIEKGNMKSSVCHFIVRVV